jgi:hypothetical protein
MVAAAQSSTPLVFPAELAAQPWAFSPGELEWLSADGPLAAGRWRFEWREHSGSLLLITSDTWRAHHRPERCFEAYGLTVDQSYSRLLNDDFPLRVIALSAGQRPSATQPCTGCNPPAGSLMIMPPASGPIWPRSARPGCW